MIAEQFHNRASETVGFAVRTKHNQVWSAQRTRLVKTLLCLAIGFASATHAHADAVEVRRSRAAIDRIIEQSSEAKFQDIPLDQAMRELGKRHGLTIALDEPSLLDEGISSDEPMTFHVSQIPLRSLLHLMLDEYGLDFVHRGGRVVVTTTEKAEATLENRVFDVSDLVKARVPLQHIMDAILVSDQTQPDIDSMAIKAIVRDRILVRQSQRRQRHTRRLLDDMRIALRLRRAHESASVWRINEALAEAAEFQFSRVTLRKLCAYVSRQHSLPVLIDTAALEEEGIAPDHTIDINLHHVSLRSAMNRILNPLELTAIVRNHVLWVTTKTRASEIFETRFYSWNHIRRLFNLHREPNEIFGNSNDPLLELIMNSTSGSWNDIHGEGGTFSAVGPLVMCTQTRAGHEEIDSLIRRLYEIKIDRPPLALHPRVLRIYQQLQTQTECRVSETPVDRVCEELSYRHKIPILFDRTALENAGIRATTKVTVELNGVTLLSTLKHFLRPMGLIPIVRDAVVLITTTDGAIANQETRVYDLAKLPFLANYSEQRVAEVIVSMTSGPWEEIDGEGGRISRLPGCIAIHQSQPIHHEIENLLRMLARNAGVSNRQLTALTPIERGDAAVSKALKQSVSVRLLRAPLNYALETLQRDYGMRYWLDIDALKDEGINLNTRVTASQSNTKLSRILDEMLKPSKLSWLVRDEVVIVTTEAAAEELFDVQVFSVPPMTDAQQQQFIDNLTERLAARSSWEDIDGFGGRATILGAHLFVRQTQHVMPVIAKELDRLR